MEDSNHKRQAKGKRVKTSRMARFEATSPSILNFQPTVSYTWYKVPRNYTTKADVLAIYQVKEFHTSWIQGTI